MIFVAARSDGSSVEYRDEKRHLWLASVLLPLSNVLFVVLAALTGSWLWLAGTILFVYVAIPLTDLVFGESGENPPSEVVEQMASDPHYRRLMFAAVPMFLASFFAGAYAVTQLELGWIAYLVASVSAGIFSGTAITIAHELGHAKGGIALWLSHLCNALTFNGHYRLEHNGGHHVAVATPEDSASARYGESFWRFCLREQSGSLKRGWALELARLRRKDLSALSIHNQILHSYAISVILWVLVLVLFGWWALPFLIIQSYVGMLHLSFANYVEHYGLKRLKRDNGRYEPCAPHHSWNTNHIASNLMLFHLQRHSDHHANPNKPYQVLKSYDQLPSLPSGYPGCFLLSMIPAVWFRVMNPRVLKAVAGDWDRVNLQPGREQD